jgi:hypothetical protein
MKAHVAFKLINQLLMHKINNLQAILDRRRQIGSDSSQEI